MVDPFNSRKTPGAKTLVLNQISNSLPHMHHLSQQGWFLCSSQFPSSSLYLGVICLVVLTFCHYTCPALNNADCCTQPPTHWKVSYKLGAQKKRLLENPFGISWTVFPLQITILPRTAKPSTLAISSWCSRFLLRSPN